MKTDVARDDFYSFNSCCGTNLMRPEIFVRISLVVNVVILIPVCIVLIAFSSSELVIFALGPSTSGCGILLSVYFAILFVSVLLLGFHVYCSNRLAIEHMVAALLATQILYKITTPFTAGPSNPVAICNLAVSILHAVTFSLLLQRYKSRSSPKNNI